ncbi:hypothetical protein OB920_17875 [Halobacteria archaeon HArc-gm2]|nr:hypothetical protein [Halobacteria archaeon HArc-gm2]
MARDEIPRYLNWRIWAASAMLFGLFAIIFASITSALVVTQDPGAEQPPVASPGSAEPTRTATEINYGTRVTDSPVLNETTLATPTKETETPLEATNEAETATESLTEPTGISTETLTEAQTTNPDTGTASVDDASAQNNGTTGSEERDSVVELATAAQVITILSGLWSIFSGFGSGLMYLVEQWSTSEPNQSTLSDFSQ